MLLEGGRFLSGTIYLRSHVTLRIEAGAKLLGSTNLGDPAEQPSVLGCWLDFSIHHFCSELRKPSSQT